jgi:trehalose 6-phosphate phosphatase
MSRRLFDATEEVGERLARASHLLFCLDFDGTLTPLVDDPAEAYLSPQVQRVLRSLAHHERVSLVLVSGRARADLQTRVGIPGLIYAGNHGLEIGGDGFIFIESAAAALCAALEELAADLTEKLQHVPGAFVEDKGLTLSVHYRRTAVADREEVRRIVEAALAGPNTALRLTRGNEVFEIRPSVSWNKGSAVRWIKERLGKPDALTIYLGDDATDEDAFEVLPEAIRIRVGNPSETAAQYQLEGPADVRRFLEWVETLLRQEASSAAATERSQAGEPEA